MCPRCPLTRAPAPAAHESSKRLGAGGASQRIETWGFPSRGEKPWAPSPPPPAARSVKFPPGEGGGLRGLPSRAAPAAKPTLPIGGRGRARVHSCTITLTHSHALTLTRVHRYTGSDVLPRRRRWSLLATRTFRASRRAGRAGRGAGGGEIDNRFGGLQGISLLEGKPHKPNPLSADDPEKSPPSPRAGANW